MSYLEALLHRVDGLDPSVGKDLRKQIDMLRDSTKFGLVFEHHLPETVELPGRPVRVGDSVRHRDGGDAAAYRVVSLRGRGRARRAGLRGVDAPHPEQEAPVGDLVVVADFKEPLYPGLRSLERVGNGAADRPCHVVVNGENQHALETLLFTHRGRVDCIYIDPPYNLGGDLTYNDRRVSKEDRDRHSLWLAFMDRRLRLAKQLLADTGVIIVAIDDTEQAHLKLLMDDVFREHNYIATAVWQGGRKNDSDYVSVGHDYMLIYARKEAVLRAAGVKWREKKPGIDRAWAAASDIWSRCGGDKAAARDEMRKWYRGLPKGDPAKALNRYSFFNNDGTLARDSDISWPGGGGPRYEVLHPVTRKPVPVPDAGWRFNSPERMAQAIADDDIIFGDDHTKPVSLKKHLESTDGQVVMSVFDRQRTHGTRQVQALLGAKRFTYPKDTAVLARWINLVTNGRPDAVILDFFAGSGSTAQAVMELNAADGGRRQALLITNNELNETAAKAARAAGHRKGDPEWEAEGIFHKVTWPRLRAAVTGLRPDKTGHGEALAETVEFFDLTYEDRDHVRLDLAFAAVAPILWLRAGATGSRLDERSDSYAFADTYGVLFDPDRWRDFAGAAASRPSVRLVYVVSESDAIFQAVVRALPPGVEPVRLYENYLQTFEINMAGATS